MAVTWPRPDKMRPDIKYLDFHSLPFSPSHQISIGAPAAALRYNRRQKITMDPPFSRDVCRTGYTPSFSSSTTYLPQSDHFSRPQCSPPISRHAPIRPGLPSVPVLASVHPNQRIDLAQKATLPKEEEVRAGGEGRTLPKEYKSSKDVASAYIQECRAWRQGGPKWHPSRTLQDYEKPIAFKMSRNDWIALSSDLNLGESDEA